MVDPTHQDLYVMQNQFGLIKIGRSLDIRQRRETLQFSECCKIKVVAVYSKCGDLEESIHVRLKEHRLAGEWFNGTELARNAIITALQDDQLVHWPYDYDIDGAKNWLDHFAVVRRAAYIRKAIYRQEQILSSSNVPHYVYDYSILGVVYLAQYGVAPVWKHQKHNGAWLRHWANPRSGLVEPVPKYSADVEAALQLWPVHIKPQNWEGTALECCIEALKAIRKSLPKVRHNDAKV